MTAGDVAWVLSSTALVLSMPLGVGLLASGATPQRYGRAALAHALLAACVALVLWVVAGYALATGPGTVVGAPAPAVGVLTAAAGGSALPEAALVAWQGAFAAVAASVVAGALGGRVGAARACAVAALWVVAVYCPVAHAVWAADGALRVLGVVDFAGGLVVHVATGASAAVLCRGLRTRGTQSDAACARDPVASGAGCAVLAVGWLGFNAGSALAASGLAAHALLATAAAGAAGAGAWAAVRGGDDPTEVGTGMLAGLVAVTPAAGHVGVGAALVLGGVAGVVCAAVVAPLRRWCGDLDVCAVHGVGGAVGAVATGALADPALGPTGGPGLAIVQAAAVAAVAAWSAGASWAVRRAVLRA